MNQAYCPICSNNEGCFEDCFNSMEEWFTQEEHHANIGE